MHSGNLPSTDCRSRRCRLPSGWGRYSTAILALLIVTAGVYLSVRQHDFVGFDDDVYVLDNPYLRDGLSLKGLRWAATAVHASTWQPVVWLSFMLDAEVYGIDPAGFHMTNVGLHLLNVLLVAVVLARVTGQPWCAASVAALFALHPVHVESVAWVAERKDVLSTVCWWLSVAAYASWVREPHRRGRYAVLLGVYMVGLMAKPMLVSLPVLLILMDWWPMRRWEGWRRQCREKWPLLVPAILSSAIAVHVQHAGGSLLPMDAVPWWGRVGNALVCPWRYVGNLVWPRHLAVLYPHPGTWSLVPVALSLTALAATLYAAWRARARRPWLWFGCVWFLVALLPVSGLVQIGWHAMADRFMYVPAIGLYVALVWTVAACGADPARRRVAVGLGLVTLVALAACSRRQISFWESSTVLFQRAVDVTADNWMMENSLGAALERAGRFAEAEPHIRRSIAIKPDRYRAYYNLGCLAVRRGNHDLAEQAFRDAIERHPGHIKSRHNLSVVLAARARLPEAVDAARALLAREPGHVPAMNNLACWLRELGRTEESLAEFARMVEREPGYVIGRFNYGVALLDAGRLTEAARQFQDVLAALPDHAGAATGLARARDAARAPVSPTRH